MLKKKLVVFSGAGISAESGIRTFRDSGGLWEQFRIEDVATPEAWHKNQALVLVNYGNATGQEILAVSKDIQATVLHKFGIAIEAEVNVI